MASGTIYKSVTYEALIYINQLLSNNTIMGNEGILILRIGDTALPDGRVIGFRLQEPNSIILLKHLKQVNGTT